MWWLIAAALAGPPAGLDLDDPAPWGEAVDRLLDGPPGCWEIVGKAVWNHDGARFGHTRGAAIFVGRLTDGVWSKLHVEPLGEIRREGRFEHERRVYREGQPFVPLLGRGARGSSGATEPENVVRQVLGELEGSARYAWVAWDDDRDGVVYTEVVPVGKRTDAPEIQTEVSFPGGGLVPARGTITFPPRVVVNDFPIVAVRDATVQIRAVSAGGEVFPSAEAYSAEVRALGFTFHSAQTIQYTRIQPCGLVAPAEGAEASDEDERRRGRRGRR